VLLLDDMQWCDQETLAWLHYFLQANRSAHRAVKPAAPLLILATARPEILQEAHPFMPVLLHLRSDEVMTEIDLEPLDDATTAALAQQVSPQPLTPAQNARLYRYTEGNPLFVIETLRTTAWQKDSVVPELSRQIEHRPHSSQAGGETGQLKLSGKVQAVIQERLSQLSPTSYRLARLASVIGRSFQFTVLQQASDEEEEVVTEGLNELWQQGIVRALGNQQYDFSHDRIREVAYLTVGPVQRPLWHRRVAKALEESNKTDLMPLNVQLASHYEQAGDIARAIDYLQQAAERAEALFAVGDAVNLLNQALTLVQTLPVNRGNKEIELRILLQLKEPLVAAQGYFEPALGEIGLHAKTLAEEVGETDQLIQALTCLHNYHQMRAEYQAARSVAEQMVNLVDRLYREPAQLKTEAAQSFARAHNALAHTLLHCGELVSARQHFEKALEFKSGSIQPFAFMAMTMWLLGYPDRARQYAYQTIAIARRRSQPMLMAFATNNIARVHHFMHNSQSMKQLTETSLALAGKYHIPFFLLLNRLFQGRILAEEGQTEEGIAQIRAMLAQLDQKNHAAFRTWFLTLLAESYACAHQFTDALETLDQALVLVERNGERFWHAELVRLQGDYRWTLGASLAAVESCYVEAIAIAQTQQAKSLQLRATVSLARLWLQEGKQKAAHTRLSEIYNWFTEGFNTADLRAARAMLAELQ
jgi:tetratricopeptide (TPR) repeat protein